MRLRNRVLNVLRNEKSTCICILLLLLASLLPLFAIAGYNVMSADDYAVGKEAHQIWLNSRSVKNLMSYSIQYMMNSYQNWKGCYTSNVLECFNPGVLGESNVWITPVIMLSTILISIFLFVKVFIQNFYNAKNVDVIIIAGVISFLTIQTIPSPVEGFFWYAGAISYTFLHFLSMLFFCVLIKEQNAETIGKRLFIMIAASIFAFIIGGFQYTTALECLIWYVAFLIMNHKKIRYTNVVPFFAMLSGFFISILAPGNAARQENANGLSPINAILNSFIEAVGFIKEWISPLFVVTLLFLIPFIWRLVCNSRKEYKYPYPIICLGASYCIFASCFTPSLYGVGNVDAGRIQNQIQIMFYIIAYLNIFYLLGWLQYKIRHSKKEIYSDINMIIYILGKYAIGIKWCMFALILLVFVGTGDKNAFSSMSALRSLVNGEAKIYYTEAQSRLDDYLNEELKVVEVTPFTVKPKVLYFNDVKAENHPDYWINENIADYYGKEKIILLVE